MANEERKNLYITGDNLDALKMLSHGWSGRVRVIYIDPPYNNGGRFIYKNFYGTAAEPHRNWIEFMRERLITARGLLADDGAVFISIGNYEYANLKLLCDGIFGERNFAETFLWTKTFTPPSISKKSRGTVEYILCYEKVRSKRKFYG